MSGDDAIGAALFRCDLFDGQDGAAEMSIPFNHLFEHAGLVVQQVIGQDDGEGLIAHQIGRAIDRMAQTQGLGLAYINAVHMRRFDVLYQGQ